MYDLLLITMLHALIHATLKFRTLCGICKLYKKKLSQGFAVYIRIYEICQYKFMVSLYYTELDKNTVTCEDRDLISNNIQCLAILVLETFPTKR